MDPLQVGAAVPHLLHRRGEEVPEEQHLRARDGVGQPRGVGETEFEPAAQRVEMIGALLEVLTEHDDDRRLVGWRADHPVNLGSSCRLSAIVAGIMEPWSPSARRGRPDQVGIGVVIPYDFALDRELWRWVPAQVSLHPTRTPSKTSR